MPINPKIIAKIESMKIPDKIKKMIIVSLQTEEEIEAIETGKEFFKNYERLLEKNIKDEELIKFCDEYGK